MLRQRRVIAKEAASQRSQGVCEPGVTFDIKVTSIFLSVADACALVSALEPLLSFETKKFAPGPLPQPFQDRPHLRQFSLQSFTCIWRCASVELNIYLGLSLARLLCRILAHGLCDEFDVKRCLHESCEGVP